MHQTAPLVLSDRFDRRQFLRRTAVGAAGVCFASRFAFSQETGGDGDLIVHQRDPLNAEPPLGILPQSYITPNKNFYVRNHGSIPNVDPAAYRLKIEGLVERPVELSLEELRSKFSQTECEATLTCAGNRRREHNAFQQVSGVQWDAGAIGHAKWTGVKLSEVLKHCGLKDGAAHVWFDGSDMVKASSGTTNFGASIPLEKTMQDGEAASRRTARLGDERR